MPLFLLKLPVILLGFILSIFSAAPWDVFLDDSGFLSAFVIFYSIVIICSIAAPKFKFTVAAVVAVAGVALCYPYPWRLPDTDVDATSPIWTWAGVVAGGSAAVLLVWARLGSRWLLLLPAYFVGFIVFLMVGSLLTFPLADLLPAKACWVAGLLPIASFGAVLFCRLMAPSHRNRVMGAAIVMALLLGIGICRIALFPSG